MYVDADSCPVKEEIVEICSMFNVEITFVSSYAHVTNNFNLPLVKTVYVDTDKEAADLYIVNNTKNNDLVVTQDTGLASILLPKGVKVISPRGKVFLESEMDLTLFTRHLKAKARRSGKYDKGPSKFTGADREKFKRTLITILSKKEGF